MKLKLILSILLLPFSVMAATNQFGDVIVFRTTTMSNATVNTRLGLSTNAAVLNGSDVIVARNPPGSTSTYFTLQDDGVAPGAGFQFGNILGNYMLIDSDGSTPPNLRLEMFGGSPGNMNFRAGTANMMILNSGSSLSTYGNGASWAHTFNGGTLTYNHHLSINGGVLVLPTTVAGNSTNGVVKGVYLGSVQGTNVIATLPPSLISSFVLEVGSTNFVFGNTPTVPMQTGFNVSSMTNSPNFNRTWVQGSTFTNAAQRGVIVVSWDMAAGAKTGVWLSSPSGSFITGIQENNDIVATEASSTIFLAPSEIFVFSNIVGTSTVTPDNTLWRGL